METDPRTPPAPSASSQRRPFLAPPAPLAPPADLAGPWSPPTWGDLVRRYGPHLRARLGRTLLRGGWRPLPERIDELVQEVYCHLLAAGGRRLGAFRGDSRAQLEAYLGRVAERIALDELRAVRSAKRDGRCLARTGSLVPEALERTVDPAVSPLDRLLVEERRRQFTAACRRLAVRRTGRRDAHIARLALLEGWTSREIARVLGGRLRPSSIDSVLHRLKRRLAAEGVDLPRRGRAPRCSMRRRRCARRSRVR